MKLYFKYDSGYFTITESRDNKHHIYIKDHHDIFIGWIGCKGLLPGSGMTTGYDNLHYEIVGVDDYFS